LCKGAGGTEAGQEEAETCGSHGGILPFLVRGTSVVAAGYETCRDKSVARCCPTPG
jgi:hypothetical protein